MKINSRTLYRKLAMHIHQWPTCPDAVYPHWTSWDNFLGKSKLTLSEAISKEWHSTKNGELTPKDITPGSNKKVWWKCIMGHEWRAIVRSRSKNPECPYCSNKIREDNCLATVNPELAEEWHPTKNEELTPKDVTRGSSKKVWWQCKKGHEWQTIVCRRSEESCPFCFPKTYCLATSRPELAKEWHPTKNEELTPSHVTVGSSKKVWWQCKKGHEWQALISNRSKMESGCGCPYCVNKKIDDNNCLFKLHPSLSGEWHPTKNGELTPKDVTPGSAKKVWWKCEKGHEWKAAINSRPECGCPCCSGRKISSDNCLATVNPQLAKEWHPTKNGELTPKDVTSGSGKKIWWKCKNGHEWRSTIGGRGRCCPCCIGRKVSEDNCLLAVNPELIREWHPTKNGELTPKDITSGSNRRVWWKCKNGHEWQTTVWLRHIRNHGCPCCSGRKISSDNCLATVNPELAEEWHPTKNGELTPKDVTSGSGKKVWWKCKKGHEWHTVISDRSRGSGCPYCSDHPIARAFLQNSMA